MTYEQPKGVGEQFAQLNPDQQYQYLLDEALRSASDRDTTAIVAVAELSGPTSPLWQQVEMLAESETSDPWPTIRAAALLSRVGTPDIDRPDGVTPLSPENYWRIARRKVRTLDESETVKKDALLEILRGQTSEARLTEILKAANALKQPIFRQAVLLALADIRINQLGQTDVANIAEALSAHEQEAGQEAKTKLAVLRAVGRWRRGDREAAVDRQIGLDYEGQLRVNVAIAALDGDGSDLWPKVEEALELPHRFSPGGRLEIIKALLSAGRTKAAATLAQTIDLPKSRSDTERVEAFMAVARQQGAAGTDEGINDANATLDVLQKSIEATLAYEQQKQPTLGRTQLGSSKDFEYSLKRILNSITIARLEILAAIRPTQAIVNLEYETFSGRTQNTPRMFARGQLAIALAQAGHMQLAVEQASLIDLPGPVQHKTYLELARIHRAQRQQTVAEHITLPPATT